MKPGEKFILKNPNSSSLTSAYNGSKCKYIGPSGEKEWFIAEPHDGSNWYCLYTDAVPIEQRIQTKEISL